MNTETKYNERGEIVHHRIRPPFPEMQPGKTKAQVELEQDQWYLNLALDQLEYATSSGSPEEWLHSLFVIKDYLWYLQK